MNVVEIGSELLSHGRFDIGWYQGLHISNNFGKLLHEFYCIRDCCGCSQFDSFGGAVRKLWNKRSSIPLCQKYDIVALFNSENGTKVAKLARDFNIPTTTLTTILKDNDRTISQLKQENTMQ